MTKRLATQDAIHDEYNWDTIVEKQFKPLVARLAEEAPPLDVRFQVGGVDVPQQAPQALQDDVTAFVNAVNEGVTEKPKRRVAPLATQIINSSTHGPISATNGNVGEAVMA